MFKNENSTRMRIKNFLELENVDYDEINPKANSGGQDEKNGCDKIRGELREKLRSTAEGVRQRYGITWDWV